MADIKGLTPETLWITIGGIVALCLIFMVGFNVYDALYKISQRRKEREEARQPDLADKISRQVLERIEPRLSEIESKLDSDKSRLDNHERLIVAAENSQHETRDGLVAICKYLMAITQYGNLGGNSKEMKDATAEMTRYLASRL